MDARIIQGTYLVVRYVKRLSGADSNRANTFGGYVRAAGIKINMITIDIKRKPFSAAGDGGRYDDA
jgi:hypothetical protein